MNVNETKSINDARQSGQTAQPGCGTIIAAREPREEQQSYMSEYCGKLDYLYRLLGRMTTEQGRNSVIDGIKQHFREGHEGKRCPDPENRYA